MSNEKRTMIKEFLEGAKAKGAVTEKEVLDFIEEAELDETAAEKLYVALSNGGIKIDTDFDIPADIEELEIEEELTEEDITMRDEDIEKVLVAEGVTIDDPVRMY
jgi:hypothetical protein